MKRFAFLLVTLLSAASCNDDITGLGPPSDPAKETFAASLGVDISSMSKTTSGVYYKDIVVGSSTAPEVTGKTDTVRVTYAGYLKDGTLFDSRANTLLAPSSLIAGFRDGMVGMREGGKRKIDIGASGFDFDRFRIDVNYLERIGPRLIADIQRPGGERVLVWTR